MPSWHLCLLLFILNCHGRVTWVYDNVHFILKRDFVWRRLLAFRFLQYERCKGGGAIAHSCRSLPSLSGRTTLAKDYIRKHFKFDVDGLQHCTKECLTMRPKCRRKSSLVTIWRQTVSHLLVIIYQLFESCIEVGISICSSMPKANFVDPIVKAQIHALRDNAKKLYRASGLHLLRLDNSILICLHAANHLVCILLSKNLKKLFLIDLFLMNSLEHWKHS